MTGRVVALLVLTDQGYGHEIHPQRCPVVNDAVDPRSWGMRCYVYHSLNGVRMCPFLAATAELDVRKRCTAPILADYARGAGRDRVDCSVICLLAKPNSTAAGV